MTACFTRWIGFFPNVTRSGLLPSLRMSMLTTFLLSSVTFWYFLIIVVALVLYLAANVFINRLNGTHASQELGVVTLDQMLVLPVEQDADEEHKPSNLRTQIKRVLENAVRYGAASIARTFTRH